jgi:hypothetical protein
MATECPNVKYDHVYAIIRLDKDGSGCARPDRNLVTITKVLRSKEDAEREAKRLNTLNADKGCEYYCQVTRLERQIKTEQEPSLNASSPSLASE